jgi:hypothetical protein
MTKQPDAKLRRLAWRLRRPLHTYVIPVSPKMLRETMCVAEFALHELERQRPGYSAGASIATHLEHIQAVLDECDRKRPTGTDGKHGNLHTDECGCNTRPST